MMTRWEAFIANAGMLFGVFAVGFLMAASAVAKEYGTASPVLICAAGMFGITSIFLVQSAFAKSSWVGAEVVESGKISAIQVRSTNAVLTVKLGRLRSNSFETSLLAPGLEVGADVRVILREHRQSRNLEIYALEVVSK